MFFYLIGEKVQLKIIKIDLHLMTDQRNLIFRIINKQKINKGDVSKFFTWRREKINKNYKKIYTSCLLTQTRNLFTVNLRAKIKILLNLLLYSFSIHF